MAPRAVGDRRAAALILSVGILGSAGRASGQEVQIGIIDFYGLDRVSGTEVRRALTFKEGDTISPTGDHRAAIVAESERRLATLASVARGHVNLVCCEAGRWIAYVGIEEKGRAAPSFRTAPRGNALLAADIVQAGHDLDEAWMAAVQRGDADEDDSQGHALFHDPAARAVQERFIVYAARDLKDLRRVLRDSSDAEQRALAAQVLGYTADKQAVVADLVYAMRDPFGDVRNNAMRALAVFASRAPSPEHQPIRVPSGPFVGLLNSPVWTDRNKASLALMKLTERRDPKPLAQLRREAMGPLVEMARWKSEGHALPAFTILGRISGLSDEAIYAAWTGGERENVIKAALERR